MAAVWNRITAEGIGQKLTLMQESSDTQIMPPPQV
jgi:hypothetical protein